MNRRRRERRRQKTKIKKRYKKINEIYETGYGRTLRLSARRHLNSQVNATFWIPPWVKERTFRYDPCELHPEKSFLGLPAELRQGILGHILDNTCLEGMTRQKIRLHIGKLCSLHPLIRLDMVYIENIWKTQKRKSEQQSSVLPLPSVTLTPFIVKGQPAEQQAATSIQATSIPERPKWHRDMQCWYCKARHHSYSKVCPMSVEKPSAWHRMTRSLHYKNRPMVNSLAAQAKRIIFDD